MRIIINSVNAISSQLLIAIGSQQAIATGSRQG